jgi:hypothetical protein
MFMDSINIHEFEKKSTYTDPKKCSRGLYKYVHWFEKSVHKIWRNAHPGIRKYIHGFKQLLMDSEKMWTLSTLYNLAQCEPNVVGNIVYSLWGQWREPWIDPSSCWLAKMEDHNLFFILKLISSSLVPS